MSDPRSVLLAAVEAAERASIDYLIYGGIAASMWGEPRYTEDVDLVLFVPERRAFEFLRSAASCGFAVEEDLALQQLQISGWARLPFGNRKSPWHLDMTLGDTPFDESARGRRRRVVLFDREFWVASPEDLVIYKAVSGRDRDLLDIDAVGRRQTALDAAYMRQWADWWVREGVGQVRERVERAISASPPP